MATLRWMAATVFLVGALGCGPEGNPGDLGEPGDPGLACWDLDGDGIGDPGEDLNDDGLWDAEDCLQVPGTGLAAMLSVGPPESRGTFFKPGEQMVATIELMDETGFPVVLGDLSRANLYLYGPQGVGAVETASALLNTTTDRVMPTHHYVDLKTTTDPNLVTSGNVLTYTMEPIADDPPGTYTVGLWAARADDNLSQVFELANVQLGTDVVEGVKDGQIVGNCEACHLGAASGKMYLHHIDPGSSPTGNWALDRVPVRTCKSCHNNDGYAAFSRCSDGSLPDRSVSPAACSGEATLEKVPDPIVRRVHGVHNGENLTTAFNVDPVDGDFRHYSTVAFPADIRSCTKCHLDDSWKTEPSGLACGSCHDALDFDTGIIDPPETIAGSSCVVADDCTMIWLPGARRCTAGVCERTRHSGGAAVDAVCIFCHDDGALAPIAEAHVPSAPAFDTTVEVTLSPPGDGAAYEGSEQPLATLTVRDAAGVAVDPATITDTTFNTLRFFVHGPRSRREPVLTGAASGIGWARAVARSAKQPAGGWSFSAATSLTVKIDGTVLAVALPPVMQTTGITADAIVTWLNGDAAFAPAATALKSVVTSGSSAGTYVQIKSDRRGTLSSVEVPAAPGELASIMGWPTTVAVAVPSSYPYNDLRLHPLDPTEDVDSRVTRTPTGIEYRMDEVAGLVPGTYVATAMVRKTSSAATKVTWATFQVGTAEEEPKIATNCTDCHESTSMHGSYPFDVDVCGNCHDYRRQFAARLATDPLDGWGNAAAPGRSNQGFGSAPIARRVHGVHFLRYLEKPGQVHSSFATENHILFPQDVRNCVKCHSETDSWASGVSRIACLACHDDDAAIAHGSLMTFDPTPDDPWSGDEDESCQVCHAADDGLSPSEVHNVWDPYRPPYPRDPT